MDLIDVFGINVKDQFLNWFNGDFAKMFGERFPGKSMTLIILDPDDLIDLMTSWRNPLSYEIIEAHLGDEGATTDPDGTRDNVVGKLRFVLRTLSDSVVAETEPQLVREGDFPWEGAGSYEGYIGGVSGLRKEDDWKIFCMCVDKLNELVGAVNIAAMARAAELREQDDCPAGTKYLQGIDLTEEPAQTG